MKRDNLLWMLLDRCRPLVRSAFSASPADNIIIHEALTFRTSRITWPRELFAMRGTRLMAGRRRASEIVLPRSSAMLLEHTASAGVRIWKLTHGCRRFPAGVYQQPRALHHCTNFYFSQNQSVSSREEILCKPGSNDRAVCHAWRRFDYQGDMEAPQGGKTLPHHSTATEPGRGNSVAY